jgi:enoyl-CoA hydratase
MSYKNISINKDNNLGFLTIKRDKEKNSLDIETSKEIYNGLKDLESNNKIRCIALKGNEKIFSSGADINELNSLDSNSAIQKNLFSYFDKIEEIQIPIVALVEGYALGGGMELALICDFIIASSEAKFGQPEVNLGLIPGVGGTQRLKEYIGKYNANFLCMSGDIFSANEALNYGFVSKVIEKKNFKEESLKILMNIASKPKTSLIEIKRLNQTEYIKKGLKMERESFYKLLNSLNKKEGISSFLNKRKPNFKD